MDLTQDVSIENALVRQFFDRLQLSFLDEFDKDAAQPAITLKKRRSQFQITSHGDGREEIILSTETNEYDRLITYSWPGKSPYEAWKFSMWPLRAPLKDAKYKKHVFFEYCPSSSRQSKRIY